MGITYKESVWLINPHSVNEDYLGGVSGCPKHHKIGNECTMTHTCIGNCESCWNHEITYPIVAEAIVDGDIGFGKHYNIGDKFIVTNVDIGKDVSVFYLFFPGQEVSIMHMLSNFKFYIYKEGQKMQKEFPISNLRTGMVVRTRSKEKFIVIGNRIVGEKAWAKKDWLGSSESNEIMEVYAVSDSVTGLDTILHEQELGTLIWTCAKEISADEAFRVLREHYGCDVRIKE